MATAEKKEPRRAPPVCAWRTLQNFFRSLSQAIPSRIDRSVLRSQSGAGQTQILNALRYLSLIDEEGIPTERLAQLVKSEGAEHQRTLREVLTNAYPFLREPKFNLKAVTHDQLAERFKELATGDTVRKAMTFFIPAAKDAGLEMSPFIRDIGKRGMSNGKVRRLRPNQKVPGELPAQTHDAQPRHAPAAMSWHELLLSKFPSFDPSWPDDVKKKWFDSFIDLMQRGQERK
ncbi:MAG TPA: DUF5343 domain-containing protein [Burkholderiales bacterium]|nr:DUF5343 domain-containing protein [Burkholderiales bacterium]